MEETVRREVFEETGLRIQVEKAICVVPHAYSHFRITLHAFHARHLSGRAQARSSQRVRWVRRAEFGDYAFPVANRKVIAQLL